MISLSRSLHKFGRRNRLGLPLVVTASFLGGATTAQAQTFKSTPLTITGYNLAGIVNGNPTNTSSGISAAVSTSTGPSSVNGGTVDQRYLYYATGFDSDAPTTGLPVGATFSSAATNTFGTGTVTFAIANASKTSATPNISVLYAGSTSSTLTLSSPTSGFTGLAFLATGYQGSQTINYSLNYTTGAAGTGTFTTQDNFNGSNAALVINGRVDTFNTAFSDVNSGNPRLYESDITGVDSSRTLSSVTFSEPGLTGKSGAAILGITGIRSGAAPEPGSVALLALAGLPAIGVIARRRRKAA